MNRPQTIQNVDGWEQEQRELLRELAGDRKVDAHPLGPFLAAATALLLIIAGELIRIRLDRGTE